MGSQTREFEHMNDVDLARQIEATARDVTFYANCDAFNRQDRENESAARRRFYALTAERDRRALVAALVPAQ